MKRITRFVAAAMFVTSTGALAQSTPTRDDPNTIGEASKSENLPPAESTNDPRPPVAAPDTPETGMVRQAGIGGEVAYGRAGVVELGGSAGFTASSNFTNLTFSPSVGWFFQDNLQLSGILNVNFNNVTGNTNTFISALVEPSYHLPFSNQVFGFLGFGVGVGYAAATSSTNDGFGLALAPRLGANILLGRSGILTPAAFLNYSTVDVSGNSGETTFTVKPTYGLQIGYTIML